LAEWAVGASFCGIGMRHHCSTRKELLTEPTLFLPSARSRPCWASWVVAVFAGFLFSQNAWAQFRELAKPEPETLSPIAAKVVKELGVGSWIWTTNFLDQQTCRVWRSFFLPKTNHVQQAILRITADNLYRLYLDGREIGEGGNWKSLTEYDLTFLLSPGTHVLAVEAFSDSLEAGILIGLQIHFADNSHMQVLSDESWYRVPNDAHRWTTRTRPNRAWPRAKVVAVVGQSPWWLHPISTIKTPPLRPPELHFWQSAWFLVILLAVCIVTLALSVRLAAKLAVQTQAQKLLELERARIARDIHDDMGAALTQLVLQGEVAQTQFPEDSNARAQFGFLCDRARSVSHALDEVVWAVNSKRDTLRDFSSYLCKYAQAFLSTTSIRCRLDVQPDMPASAFDLPVRRGLLLAVKEALNNAAKHSEASELFLRIYKEGEYALVVVEDNGKGFDAALLNTDRNGLENMSQRLSDLGGRCEVVSASGAGCRIEFKMPLAHPASGRAFSWKRFWHKHQAAAHVEPGEQPYRTSHGQNHP
jgi:signal transduction histidine kinase